MGVQLVAAVFAVSVLYAVPLSCGAYNHIIIVNSTAGGESNSTCEHDLTRGKCICPSLETLHNEGLITCSLKVVIEGPALNLTELVAFEHIDDIALVGSSGGTVITCMPKESSGAGLAFLHVRNLTIEDLAFEHCGALHNSTSTNVTTHNTTIMFSSSIFLQWCMNVELTRVIVRKSNGVGVVFFDTNGIVSVADSDFEENMVSDNSDNSGGGGVYIEFTACTPGIYWPYGHTHGFNSQYTIWNCTFQSNVANSSQQNASHFVFEFLDDYQGLGKGGGLFAALRGNTSNNLINVSNCTFENNSALWGGGLHITINDASKKNLVNIGNCHFLRNKERNERGGGAYIAYQTSNYASPKLNSIIFEECWFEENMAMHGGGLILAAHYDNDKFNFTDNNIEFKRCKWLRNEAKFGSAVDTIVFSPYIFITPKLTFENCEFIGNEVQNRCEEMEKGDGAVKEVHWGGGAFTVNTFRVWFEESVYFYNNSGTALSVIASAVSFSSGMNATFVENHGRRGGAIALMASSEMYVDDNSMFNFIDNSATMHGGAIYAEFADKHDDASSHRCFIQYRGPPCSLSNEFRNIIFFFARNTLGDQEVGLGGSMYISSLSPCETLYGTELSHLDSELEQNISCLATFVFDDAVHYNNQTGVTTAGNKLVIEVNDSLTLLVIPGKEFNIPVVAKDDLGHNVSSTFHVSIMNAGNINASVDPAYSYISDSLMKLHGQSGEHGFLILERTGCHELSLHWNFTLLQCPPGYLLDENNNGILTCKCAWNLKPYLGLQKCNNTLFQSSILNGYWSGYVGSNATPENLFTGNCPLGFCSYGNHLLPGSASKQELDEFVCGPSRTGVICGRCAANHSVYFHSPDYECKEDNLCHLGWLFYILSELLPLTVIFITVMILNISFTSGGANGFIFFAQVLDTLSVEVNQNYSGISFLITLERFIYHFFNLDFFSHNSLSFCIKKGATTLDFFAFKYVTIAYALVLVFTTIVVMNLCNLRVYRMFPCVKVNTVKSSVIHGLSAFLIMCYTQCTFVSLRILVPTNLHSLDIQRNHKVVYYNGNIGYLHYDHLPYALPAFVCMITIVAIPPLLLLWYPTGQRLLQYCGLGDTKVVKYASRLVPIERLKPLLDSFQSCFKDNCRFFAGLYFVYRIFALVGYVMVTSLTQFFSFVTVLISLMLMLHAIAQPYQNHWHNIVDALLFTNLALINGLTLYIYSQEIGGYAEWNSKSIHFASIVQVALLYLPLVCMTTYVGVKIGCKIKLLAQKKNVTDSSTEDCDFPPRLIENSSDSEENLGYHELQGI